MDAWLKSSEAAEQEPTAVANMEVEKEVEKAVRKPNPVFAVNPAIVGICGVGSDGSVTSETASEITLYSSEAAYQKAKQRERKIREDAGLPPDESSKAGSGSKHEQDCEDASQQDQDEH